MLTKTELLRKPPYLKLLEAGLMVLVFGLPLFGQGISPAPINPSENPLSVLTALDIPRVADPKLENGEIPVRFQLMPLGKTYQVKVQVLAGGGQVFRDLYSGSLQGSPFPYLYPWDGKDALGNYADPGDYTVYVEAKLVKEHTLILPISIVRLGITEMKAMPGLILDEWQMVYFRKNNTYAFYATPAIHEYVNKARTGEISDLDLDDSTPRPPAPLHEETDEPVMNGVNYETFCYNYPLCYRVGSEPVFAVTMGDSCTSYQGSAVPCGYPIPGVAIRGAAMDDAGEWSSTAIDISPGSQYIYTGPSLSLEAARDDRVVTWKWQYLKQGELAWQDIPGTLGTEHRFFTILNAPVWATGASGTQYTGPWVEVMDYFCLWSEALGFDTFDEAGVVKALVRGYFGQEGPLTEAIEGVIYDTYTMGGDGGASHYYSGSSTQLSKLLHGHANGVYVNCSDVASTASVMIGMLGVQEIQMVHLGYMNLKAIWGIGCPDYTLNLWGGGSHAFSYHHIMTRDKAVHVSDCCMWLDEDGFPDFLPGTPGYNHDRPWAGRIGYDFLSASNKVNKSLDPLPKIK